MVVAIHPQYRIHHGEEPTQTYTQEEAIEIARKLALESGQEVMIYAEDGQIKARVFVHDNTTYVDYYLTERIAACELIVQGKPRIARTRIPVNIILNYMAQGATVADLISEEYYPDLTEEDIYDCLAYASRLVSDSRYSH
jgi:uncharacterized protein (DUF433 family)